MANAVNAIINGQAWDAIKDNFVKAANGDQIALENSAALLIGIITPSKGLGNVGKTEKLINKSDKVISDANKAGKLDEALSDVNKLDKEYFENQYGKNNVEQGFGDYKETKDNINNNQAVNQQANKNSNFDEYVVNEKGLENARKQTNKFEPTTLSELHSDLISKGFQLKGTSTGGYTTYKHPDGRIVTVKPTGKVIPTKPKIAENGKKYNERSLFKIG